MTAAQGSLFAAEVTRGSSRRTDPSTSRDAGRSVAGPVLRAQQMTVLCAVADVSRHHDGATAYEVWDQLDGQVQQNVIAKRLGELAERGMVRLSGTHRPGSSHRMLQVYALAETGRAVIARCAA